MNQELLAACRAAPDDDAARLVWADAIGGERGELVVLQCDLARLPLSEAASRWHRVQELLTRHGRAWSGLDGLATSCKFRRGFVEHVEIDLERCVVHADELAKAAPLLRSIKVRCLDFGGEDMPGSPMHLVERLFAHPALRHVRGFVFTNAERPQSFGGMSSVPAAAIGSTGYGDDIVDLAVTTGRLAELREIGFSSCGLRDGVVAIGKHGAMLERLTLGKQLQRVGVGLYEPSLDIAVPPLESWAPGALPRLEALALYELHASAVPHLPASLVELELGTLDNTALDALIASPIAKQLRRLSVVEGTLPATKFSAFTALREQPLDTVTVDLT